MMKTLLSGLVLIAIAGVAGAFPTKVKVLKDPDLLSSEGTQVILKTSKGSLTASYRHPAYAGLSKARKGQCLILETESESTADFGKKVDQSGVNTVTTTRC